MFDLVLIHVLINPPYGPLGLERRLDHSIGQHQRVFVVV